MYLITSSDFRPYLTDHFDPEIDFGKGMIVFDLECSCYTLDGDTWVGLDKYESVVYSFTPAQIVRQKYPKAWSQGHPVIDPKLYTINSGKYESKLAYPSLGKQIGKGKTLKQAWKNAAQGCR